jgi:hypothetical protein
LAIPLVATDEKVDGELFKLKESPAVIRVIKI